MTDKTFSSSKSSSSSSSSSSLALKAETTKSVVTFLSLSFRVWLMRKQNLTKAHKVSFFLLCRVRDERRGQQNNKEKKEHKPAERFERFSQNVAETQEKRHAVKRQKTKNFSRFFSLSLSRVLLSIAFGRYESYLINLFLQEESFHDERRREKGKRIYYISSRRRQIVFLVFVGEF